MSAKFVLEGVGAGAIKVVEQLNKALDGTEKEAESATKSTKRLEEQLQKQAQRIKEMIDPQERLNRKHAELNKHVASGRLTLEQANRAMDQYANAGKRAFGADMIRSVASMAAGYLSMGAAVGAIKSALSEMEQQAQRSADAVFNSLAAAGELQQLAETPEQFQSLLAESRSLVRRGIVRPDQESQAFSTVFNLQSAGFSREEREALFRPAEGKQIADIVGLGGKLRSLQDIFGVEDTGTISVTLDKVLATSKATLENATLTAQAAPEFGTEARALGVDVETALAAYIAVRKQSASSETAATRLKQFFSVADARGLWKGDLQSTVNDIQRQIDGGKTAQSILGNVRAVAGFRALSTPEGRAIFAEQLPKIQGAIGATEAQRFIETDPRLRASSLRESSEGRLAFTTSEMDAEREELFAAYRAELNTLGRNRGEWAITHWLRNKELGAVDIAGTEADAFRAEITQSQLTGQRISDPLMEAMQDYLRRIAEATESNSDETKQLKEKQHQKSTTRAE